MRVAAICIIGLLTLIPFGAGSEKLRNRLAGEKSAYLLEHKDDPVWWYPWGADAFAAARERSVPIFLSIGYSSCHWCHVMERESFADAEVARLLNTGFVSIKVDREERPDVDALYMEAVQQMACGGGWPMTIVMTPDGKPFFGGGYFSKANLLKALEGVRTAWSDRRASLEKRGQAIADALEREARQERAGQLDEHTLQAFLAQWMNLYDAEHGGQLGAPKFPLAHDLRLLLRIHRRTGSTAALAAVRKTLDEMARGGIYDHLGGGFHRYSVDDHWGVPHFEKMLYDQASLGLAYLEAWEVTGDREYELVTREVLDYVLRDMSDRDGGFYAAEDADSVGVEGKFYLWTDAELKAALSAPALSSIRAAFELEERGVLRARSQHPRSDRTAAQRTAMADLLARRAKRARPHRDHAILTDWNGMMIAVLARAGRALPEPRYTAAAERAASFLLAHSRREDGRLLHRWSADAAGVAAFLDDYAFLTDGLIELYQADFDARWLHAAATLHDMAERSFFDAKRGDYLRDDGSDPLVFARRSEACDVMVPAGRSVVALNALRLSGLLARPELTTRASAIIASTSRRAASDPSRIPQLLIALDYALDRSKEVAVVGATDDPRVQRLLATMRNGFHPTAVFAAGPGGAGADIVPILRGRTMLEGRPTVYVCENQVCSRPTTDPDEARRMTMTTPTYAEAAR